MTETLKIENIRKIDKMVFVATCPRSRSSMTCGVLARSGAFSGHTNGVTDMNIRGQYENGAIFSTIFGAAFNKLGDGGRSPEMLAHLNLNKALPELGENFEATLSHILGMQGYDGGVAFIKGGPFMFFADQITALMPDAAWVLPVRNRTAIRKSMINCGWIQSDEQLDRTIEAYRDYGYDRIKTTSNEVYEIDTDKLAARDYTEAKACVAALGLEWDEDRVNDWIKTPEELEKLKSVRGQRRRG